MAGAPALAFGSQQKKGRENEDRAPGGAGLEAAGIEFTNGDQPGLRLTKGAAARFTEPGSAQSRRVFAKVVRGKTAKANEKKR